MPTTLLSLPLEILLQILSYFIWGGIENSHAYYLATICRQLRSIVIPLFFKNLDLRFWTFEELKIITDGKADFNSGHGKSDWGERLKEKRERGVLTKTNMESYQLYRFQFGPQPLSLPTFIQNFTTNLSISPWQDKDPSMISLLIGGSQRTSSLKMYEDRIELVLEILRLTRKRLVSLELDFLLKGNFFRSVVSHAGSTKVPFFLHTARFFEKCAEIPFSDRDENNANEDEDVGEGVDQNSNDGNDSGGLKNLSITFASSFLALTLRSKTEDSGETGKKTLAKSIENFISSNSHSLTSLSIQRLAPGDDFNFPPTLDTRSFDEQESPINPKHSFSGLRNFSIAHALFSKKVMGGDHGLNLSELDSKIDYHHHDRTVLLLPGGGERICSLVLDHVRTSTHHLLEILKACSNTLERLKMSNCYFVQMKGHLSDSNDGAERELDFIEIPSSSDWVHIETTRDRESYGHEPFKVPRNRSRTSFALHRLHTFISSGEGASSGSDFFHGLFNLLSSSPIRKLQSSQLTQYWISPTMQTRNDIDGDSSFAPQSHLDGGAGGCVWPHLNYVIVNSVFLYYRRGFLRFENVGDRMINEMIREGSRRSSNVQSLSESWNREASFVLEFEDGWLKIVGEDVWFMEGRDGSSKICRGNIIEGALVMETSA